MAQPYSLPMDKQTEQILVQRIVQGDADEFGTIVAAHSQRMVSLAWRLTGNRDDAEDIAQEAFLRLYKALSGLRGECTLATWLYQTVSRLAIDYLRRDQLRRKIFWFRQEEQDGPEERVADPAAGPRDRLLEAERRQRLRRALQTLSPRQRAIFVLRHDEGLPLKEIAALLGLEEGTVKVHLHRAVKALGKELADLVEKNDGREQLHG
jgi:RNA polymerase sigma-70 factor, ECF subfamily